MPSAGSPSELCTRLDGSWACWRWTTSGKVALSDMMAYGISSSRSATFKQGADGALLTILCHSLSLIRRGKKRQDCPEVVAIVLIQSSLSCDGRLWSAAILLTCASAPPSHDKAGVAGSVPVGDGLAHILLSWPTALTGSIWRRV